MKDINGRLTLGDHEVRRIWKDYIEDLYNIDTQEQVAFTCCFDGVLRSKYFGGELIRRNRGKSED